MKKYLVLAIVMLMASMANAVLLELSVNGQIAEGPAEITLFPSQTFVLDIWDSQGYTIGQDGYLVLTSDSAVSSINIDEAIILPDHLDTEILGGSQELDEIGFPGVTGLLAFVGYYGVDAVSWAPGKVMDNIIFHCEAPGDTVIQLLWTHDFSELTVVDSVIVHQIIPEPATLALLGLGAVMFIRKRK